MFNILLAPMEMHDQLSLMFDPRISVQLTTMSQPSLQSPFDVHSVFQIISPLTTFVVPNNLILEPPTSDVA